MLNEKYSDTYSKEHLKFALENSNMGVWDYNFTSDSLQLNTWILELFKIKPSATDFSFDVLKKVIHVDDFERTKFEFTQACRTRSDFKSNFRITTPTGSMKYIRAIGSYYKNDRGDDCSVSVIWDVSDEKSRAHEIKRVKRELENRNNQLHEAKAKLEHLALHDALTGLPNRRYLEQILETRLDGSLNSLLMIDLDRFKSVNDTLGHAAGDALLKHVAKILNASVMGTDFVARTGGDEFIILCFQHYTRLELNKLAGKIISEISQPFEFDADTCSIGASLGVVPEIKCGLSADKLLGNADLALYEAKQNGRNHASFFEETLRESQLHRKRLAEELLDGLERNEFIPFFQPQFNSDDLEVSGLEVLVRWHHPSRGILPPGEFLDAATDLGITSKIDNIVLNSALFQATAWKAKGIKVPKISVNVSQQRLADEHLIDELRAINFGDQRLSFELVESIFLDDADPVILSNIDEIKNLGIEIEIDDFGTAYTSLLSLLKIKPACLKIDRQLVGPAVNCAQTRHVIKSIVDIAKSLDMEIIAEGVETSDHIELMGQLGCDALQGYFFGYPMVAFDCEQLIGNPQLDLQSISRMNI